MREFLTSQNPSGWREKIAGTKSVSGETSRRGNLYSSVKHDSTSSNFLPFQRLYHGGGPSKCHTGDVVNTEIRVASLNGRYLRAKFQNQAATWNQSETKSGTLHGGYTDLCRFTSSVRNISGPVSDEKRNLVCVLYNGIILIFSCFLYRERLSYFKPPQIYFNLFDWLGLILIVIVIPLRFSRHEAQWFVASLGFFFNVLRLLKYSCITR